MSRMRTSSVIRTMTLAAILAGCGSSLQAETVLITGANSGLGLEMAQQYAEKGWTVIATHRRDRTPETLRTLMDRFDGVRVERLDVTRQDQISALAEKLRGEPIDLLINNAGVMTLDGWARGVGAGQRFDDLDFDHFAPIMEVNVKGAMMVTQALYPNVRMSDRKTIVAITSSHGSISDPPPTTTNALWYGASKAALNKLLVVTSSVVAEEGVIVVPIHPGSVSVDRPEGEPLPEGMLEAPYAVGKLIETIDGLTMSSSGKFLQYDGEELAW